MEEKIKSLFQSVNLIAMDYLFRQKQNNIKPIQELIPQIQEFVLWFLEENRFGIEEELYRDMQNYLLQVLEDISTAMSQEDRVLLHDAIAYGLIDYLKLFVELQEAETDDNL
ncbi:MAG: hypothetical protein K1V96_10820 [Lachnospiraceae bacterium]